jgi:hypothetical protein
MFQACNSRFSLTKRHYTKGFYFTHSKNGKISAITQNKRADQKALVAPPSLSPIQINETDSKPVPIAEIPIGKVPGSIPTRHLMQKKTAPAHASVNLILEQPKHTIGKNSENIQTSNNGNNEGRSLFWIVIIVIVILWAVGLISGGLGLGILINLLLLVALILLILWLLRIV